MYDFIDFIESLVMPDLLQKHLNFWNQLESSV